MGDKKPILDLLQEQIVILDGAMGSLLMDQGLPAGTPPEIWNGSNSDKIKKIHKMYFKAGSNVVLTNTFGGSGLKLGAYKHGNNIEEYNHKAVSIALEACPENGYVAGDIGPSGAFLPPVGDITIIDFESNYLEQMQVLADAGVDLFFIETMVDLREAEAAVKAAKNVSQLPVFVSMTYKKTKRGFFTIMGNSVEQCVDSLQKLGVDAIGANCTIGSDDMIDLIQELNQLTELPIIAKPNAGLPQLINGETIYPTKSKDFAKDISKIVENNARIVGGCCGTDPAFIEKIAQMVKG